MESDRLVRTRRRDHARTHRLLARSAGVEPVLDRRSDERMVRIPVTGIQRHGERTSMKSEFIGAGSYLAAFSRLLECIEITTGRGDPLPLDEGIGSITEAIVSLKTRSGKAFLIGNGGSAAIVSHVHNDLCKSAGIRT